MGVATRAGGMIVTTEANKAVVRRFIEEVLDAGNTDLMLELFTPDCVIHFAHVPKPHIGNAAYAAALAPNSSRQSRFVTTIEHMIAEGDFVAVQLRHEVTYTADVPSRVGMLSAAGKSLKELRVKT
jgi:predicted SnoaL-like aldol condensation-catalyzing enzyme